MAAQIDMFGFKKLRAQPLVRAHIVDAGAGMTKAQIGKFECRCGWRSGWVEFETVTEGKRGIPCPVCNEVKQ